MEKIFLGHQFFASSTDLSATTRKMSDATHEMLAAKRAFLAATWFFQLMGGLRYPPPPMRYLLAPPLEFHQQLIMVIVSDVRIHDGWAAKIARGRPTSRARGRHRAQLYV